MVGRSDIDRENIETWAAPANVAEVKRWFVCEVLPLEAGLMQFLQHNWRDRNGIYDLRQEVYVRVFRAALKEIPDRPKQFVFAIARNLLIDCVRRENVVPIEAVSDLEALEVAADVPGPERTVQSRDELRQLQVALDRLPPQCRQTVILGRIEGLSRREIAERMGIAEATVAKYTAHGIRTLTNILYSEVPSMWRQL
jgi:RNA polymerase sigma factor (sigma-70 family)